MKHVLLIAFVFFFCLLEAGGQLPYGLQDGRDGNDGSCQACEAMIHSMPPEVLFGIDIHANGEVFFSMSNKEWFNKLFSSDEYAITADIVSKDRYACNNDRNGEDDLLRGFLLAPVYRPQFRQNMQELAEGNVMVKIGKLPAKLLGKELEGNMVIIRKGKICYYNQFLNIDRSVWELLPMGLYSDSLVRLEGTGSGDPGDFFTYEKKLQVTIPFAKNKTDFNSNDIKPLYDSLQLQSYSIRKIEIRAYSSVEGAERSNTQLMKGRAEAMINALKKVQPRLDRILVTTAENWIEFLDDIKTTPFKSYAAFSKAEIKRKLLDRAVSEQLEPLLASHRKAVVTVFLQRKTPAAGIGDNALMAEFNKAVTGKDIQKARMIQKEMVDRIADNKLPAGYLDKLEVPSAKEYLSLLNDREMYKYLLQRTSEYEALDNFLAIQRLDPLNGKISYNICALRFFVWQNGGEMPDTTAFRTQISSLERQGIDGSLVKRMLINYHILICGEYMKKYNYAAKDRALAFIRNTYTGLVLNDEDRYSLAKYFTFYSHQDWAGEIITPRIGKLDVSENLVFYYINLLFYNTSAIAAEDFEKVVINAINLNRVRFCNFFLSINKGGASMQLLEDDMLKKFYCESCTGRSAYGTEMANDYEQSAAGTAKK